MRLRSRSGRDVTKEYPQLQSLAADLADHHVVLDGEVVALDKSGVPSFNEMQNRGRAHPRRVLGIRPALPGRPLAAAGQIPRPAQAAGNPGRAQAISSFPSCCPATAPRRSSTRAKHGWEGVVAKKRDSTYQPGRRSASWVKDKHWNTQEVVIGGWKAGEGGRTSGIGSLLMGIPGAGGLHFAGRVGTGFTERDLANLKKTLAPLHTDQSPVRRPASRALTPRASRSSSRFWSARCATANGPRMTGCANRVGVGYGRTRNQVRWCASEVG